MSVCTDGVSGTQVRRRNSTVLPCALGISRQGFVDVYDVKTVSGDFCYTVDISFFAVYPLLVTK